MSKWSIDPDSRPGGDSRPQAASELELRTQLLRVVMARTLKKHGIPPDWISAAINTMSLPSGEVRIEVRLSMTVDEPRFLAYISSFQADFERRLHSISPEARQWVTGIAWNLITDSVYETAMPRPEYWEHVLADRELTAHEKGAKEWDRDSLARHFVDTNPGDLVVDFDDTHPPDRNIENLADPKA